MSGICGGWAQDENTLAFSHLVNGIAYRGRDGRSEWHGENVAMAHALLAATPEAILDKMPLSDPVHRCTISADVRLDNREELASKLGLVDHIDAHGDGNLLLLAYLKWGESCTEHLLGDFAFVIWDDRVKAFFGARDHVGSKPLYYTGRPDQIFLFASDFDALNSHPAVFGELNRDRLIDFFDDMEGCDEVSTFNTTISRLPPAHRFISYRGDMKIERYWAVPQPQILELETDAEYDALFQRVFREAVACRLRGDRVGAMLSGGLDSGVVAATASAILKEQGRGRLLTFSAISRSAEYCAESDRISSYHGDPRFEMSFVDAQRLEKDIHLLRKQFSETGEPFDFWMTLIHAIYLRGSDAGVRAMLDGMGGDLSFTSGNQAAEYMARRKFRAAWRSLRDDSRFIYAERSFLWRAISSAWVAFAPVQLRRMKTYLSTWRRLRFLSAPDLKFKSDFPGHKALRQRRSTYTKHLDDIRPFGVPYRSRVMVHPFAKAARERYERAAAFAGIEPRDPYLDIRVIEFVLKLPTNQLKRHGWPKYLQRRIASRSLPNNIVWQQGKEHIGPKFSDKLLQNWDKASGEYSNLLAMFRDIIPKSELDLICEDKRFSALLPFLHLSFFLRRSKFRSG